MDPGEALARAQEVADKVLAADADAVDREARWPERGMRALLDAGLGGLVVPRAYGGLGQGLLGLAQVCETLARVCPSTAMCFGMHSVGAAVLSAKATPVQVERYLRPIAQGRHLTTLSLSEPGTGAHFYIPQTSARGPENGAYRVSGRKSFVTNGGHADSYVISVASADAAATPGQFSCLLLDGDAEGIRWGEPWSGMGMRGNSSRTMELRDARVPEENLLGQPGDEVWYVFSVVAPYFLMAMAGTYLGIASASVEDARAHLMQRRHAHSAASLAREPVLQHQLGEAWAMVERTRALVHAAGLTGDAGSPDATPLLMAAKAEAAESAVAAANRALDLLGGVGYGADAVTARRLRDARAGPVMAPTTQLLRVWTGRWLLGEPLLTE